jgi:hypothetical protein
MGYINQPPNLFAMFADIEQRLRKLETAVRFTAPSISTVPPYPRVADIVYNSTGNYVEYWNGTQWVIFGDNNVGSPKISFTSTWSATGLAYTGTPATGYYIKIGKMIFYSINVSCTNVTNFGSSQYTLTLPSGLNPDNDYQHIGGLHKGANHYTLLADLGSGSNTITLYHPTANGQQDIFSYNKPTALTTASYFYISGTYFIS